MKIVASQLVKVIKVVIIGCNAVMSIFFQSTKCLLNACFVVAFNSLNNLHLLCGYKMLSFHYPFIFGNKKKSHRAIRSIEWLHNYNSLIFFQKCELIVKCELEHYHGSKSMNCLSTILIIFFGYPYTVDINFQVILFIDSMA